MSAFSEDSSGISPVRQSVPGFLDILPDDYDYFTLIKKVARHRGRQAGFRRISTPILETADLYTSARAAENFFSSEELFVTRTSNGEELVLHPEITLAMARTYLEHNLQELPHPLQLYAIEPFFRQNDPARTLRQFWQVCFEVVGGGDASIDAQIISLGYKILQDLNIHTHFSLQLNTMGSSAEKQIYNDALRNYFYGKERHLPEAEQRQLEHNPLALFRSTNEDILILLALAPKLKDFLGASSLEHFAELKEFLTELAVPFVENQGLVRRLEYSTGTAFEFWDKNEGAREAAGGGGHHDDLIALFGGPETPAVGLSFNMEQLVKHLKSADIVPPQKDRMHVFVAQLGGVAKKKAMRILAELHDRGVHAVGAVGKSSIKHQLALADQFKVDWAVLIGEVEVRENTAILRDMQRGIQEILPLSSIVEMVVEKVGPENLDRYRLGE